jgi:tetratricopeptide (TPR) repeat protein
MRIDVITHEDEFARLRERWDHLYETDGEAQFFLSWAFISTYIKRFEGAWFILAACPGPVGSPYVAFLPMRLSTQLDKKTGQVHNEIYMAGNYAADYTGILCAPEYASRAIPALARHLKTMYWAKLHLDNLRMSAQRLRLFLQPLADDRFTIRGLSQINTADGIDNSRCPYIDLPDSWDRYLAQLSSNTRQKLRRLLRKVEDSDEFRITEADASTVKRDIEILLEFWRVKWAARKQGRMPGLLRSNRLVFKNAFATGVLYLPVLWHRDQPLGALAFFVDTVKRTMLFSMAGRDETSDVIPSGLVLHAYSLRRAIQQGFRTYDFLRGNEAYKYSFGADERAINSYLGETRIGTNLNDRIDGRSVAAVFKFAAELHKAGDLVKAEAGYRQVLKAEPVHAQTLYAFGRLLSTKGDHREAIDTFKALTAVAPNSVKVWSRLSLEYQALNRHAEALEAFRRVLSLKPGFVPALYGLSRSLIQLGRLDEAAQTIEEMQRYSRPGSTGSILAARAQSQLVKRRQEAEVSHILQRRPAAASADRFTAMTALPVLLQGLKQKQEAKLPPAFIRPSKPRLRRPHFR